MKITDMEKQIGNFRLYIENMELEKGRIHGLIGPNGSGKTTLAKIIMNIYSADKGNIDYDGISIQDCTMITQRPYLLHTSVYENLIYPLKIRKMPVDDEAVNRLLEKCDLKERKKQYARSLSSGERQKLSFARALIFSPKLILVDETFSNLDPDSVRLFEEIILERQAAEPATWIIISHQMAHICRICDQVHFMEMGRHIITGSTKEILLNPKNDAVRRYLATTEVSFFKETATYLA